MRWSEKLLNYYARLVTHLSHKKEIQLKAHHTAKNYTGTTLVVFLKSLVHILHEGIITKEIIIFSVVVRDFNVRKV